MSLPKIAELEFETDDITTQTNTNTVHTTYAWDFDTGDFVLKDGKLIELEGTEYLKTWIQKCLRTIKNTLIYEGTDYGSEHYSLIGTNFNPNFTKEEYKRYIKEALTAK